MVRNVAKSFRDLESQDFYLLSGIEHGMRFAEWVDREKLREFSGLDIDEIEHRINRCLNRKLIKQNTIQYDGYQLRFEGYDALALRSFTERDTITGFGPQLGVGKESDVYEVRSNESLALKYHREGVTNFRKVMRGRDYTADRHHVSWMYTARKAAEREYEILHSLFPHVAVPEPVDQNRHAIVMELMEGRNLSKTQLQDDQVRWVLNRILNELDQTYQMGYVHADMSEHNVFMTQSGVKLFDWPQAIPTRHENADELLDRDIHNIIQYFQRKHPRIIHEITASEVTTKIIEGKFETSGFE